MTVTAETAAEGKAGAEQKIRADLGHHASPVSPKKEIKITCVIFYLYKESVVVILLCFTFSLAVVQRGTILLSCGV